MQKLLSMSLLGALLTICGCVAPNQQTTKPNSATSPANANGGDRRENAAVETSASVPIPSDVTQKVRDVQRMLKDLGFDPGPVDGIVGKQTLTALTAFQTGRNLEVSDEVTDEAYMQVYSAVTELLDRTLNSATSKSSLSGQR